MSQNTAAASTKETATTATNSLEEDAAEVCELRLLLQEALRDAFHALHDTCLLCLRYLVKDAPPLVWMPPPQRGCKFPLRGWSSVAWQHTRYASSVGRPRDVRESNRAHASLQEGLELRPSRLVPLCCGSLVAEAGGVGACSWYAHAAACERR